jgi:4-aminobutyrate aminotransferase-like enzyme
LRNVSRSLIDIGGEDYIDAVVRASSALEGSDGADLAAMGRTPVDFYPTSYAERSDHLLSLVGTQVCGPMAHGNPGAPTEAIAKASRLHMAPIGGYGCVRVGEDGRAYLISKSEHYHASLGHRFPGYHLVTLAQRLGMDNVTHNNTRGHLTRTLEQRLVAACNGLDPDDPVARETAVMSQDPSVLNRVINLETGSLAVEAGLKMMLARFYAVEDDQPQPPYAGRVPVFLVVGDLEGGITANYHGTTILTQMLRGLWPGLARRLHGHELLKVQPVAINDTESFRRAVRDYDRGVHKVAGFLHEIVLMNYGGKLLRKEFLQSVYEVCHHRDIPVLVDEIQSCAWSPELFLYREYGLKPDLVAIGKGFPGGNTPASRIVTNARTDTLTQFGALVTNGQEEIASLYYLITMEFVRANAEAIRSIGEHYERGLRDLAERHRGVVEAIEGRRHLCGLAFVDHDTVGRFVDILNRAGIDISAQSYKAQSLPIALTKLPIVATARTVDFLLTHVENALAELERRRPVRAAPDLRLSDGA